MSGNTRLEILERSKAKKQAALDGAYDTHFADVRQANGQPLNDKRNGAATLSRWERQSQTIRNRIADLEKTDNAIEFEKSRIQNCASALSDMPPEIVQLVGAGTLIQWRKHPNTFFVNGVKKARISYKAGTLSHRFVKSIEGAEQYAKFRDVFNNLRAAIALSDGVNPTHTNPTEGN